MLTDNTAEAIREQLSEIDAIDVDVFHQPASLADETAIIAKAL